MSEQIPFGTSDFAENPEPRCACILLLDVSGSMRGGPIDELNSGLQTFLDELRADSLALKRVEVAVVTFGKDVQTISPFTTAEHFQPPTLVAEGNTPMGQGIFQTVEMLRQRKAEYKTNGIAYFRPWILMVTDGGPTDDWRTSPQLIREGEARKEFSFFAIGVQGANLDILKQISFREPLKLQGLRFRDLFVWLSKSLTSVSRSTPGDTVPLTNPAAPGGWASV